MRLSVVALFTIVFGYEWDGIVRAMFVSVDSVAAGYSAVKFCARKIVRCSLCC